MTNAQFYLEDLKTKFRKIKPEEYYLSYSGGKELALLRGKQREFVCKYFKESYEVLGIQTAEQIDLFE